MGKLRVLPVIGGLLACDWWSAGLPLHWSVRDEAWIPNTAQHYESPIEYAAIALCLFRSKGSYGGGGALVAS